MCRLGRDEPHSRPGHRFADCLRVGAREQRRWNGEAERQFGVVVFDWIGGDGSTRSPHSSEAPPGNSTFNLWVAKRDKNGPGSTICSGIQAPGSATSPSISNRPTPAAPAAAALPWRGDSGIVRRVRMLGSHSAWMSGAVGARGERHFLARPKRTFLVALHMSAFDPKRTWRVRCEMSA
jgi:hypothetical protein